MYPRNVELQNNNVIQIDFQNAEVKHVVTFINLLAAHSLYFQTNIKCILRKETSTKQI